jgi:ATP phosphoribosyltransferase regulatory subunit
MNLNTLEQSERILFSLRSLYDKYGYSRYKMNKFEEYDLYAKNKDFLISDEVITFTDKGGKLMALKPDVTLSIVKNTIDNPQTVQKLYYNENVYRVNKGGHSFKEIMQVGLEAMGNIDDYCIYEVLKLAAESLVETQKNCILEFSHLDILSELIAYLEISNDLKPKVMQLISEKNTHELSAICRENGVSEDKYNLLKEIVMLYGTISEVLPQITTLLNGIVSENTLNTFEKIATALNSTAQKDMFRIDFSIISDSRYYNGFVFRGFAEGIPASILSGGQYNSMMARMKRKSGAIGFAVYLDMLRQYETVVSDYDVDNLIIYDDTTAICDLEKQINFLIAKGESVVAQRDIPTDLKYKNLIKIKNGEVVTNE